MRSFTIGLLMVCAFGCTGEIRGDNPADDEETNSNGIAANSMSTGEPAVQITPLRRNASASWAWRGRHHYQGTGGTTAGSGGTSAGTSGTSGSAGVAGSAGVGGTGS